MPCPLHGHRDPRDKNEKWARVPLGPLLPRLCSEWPLSAAGFLPAGSLHPCPHLTHRARSPAADGTQHTSSEKILPVTGVLRRHEGASRCL